MPYATIAETHFLPSYVFVFKEIKFPQTATPLEKTLFAETGREKKRISSSLLPTHVFRGAVRVINHPLACADSGHF
jgi:hypothetical protein